MAKGNTVATSSTAFGKPLSTFQLSGGGDIKGHPNLTSEKKPWQGLAPMISETIGPIGKRKSSFGGLG